jgi:hypothetical protein
MGHDGYYQSHDLASFHDMGKNRPEPEGPLGA